MRNLFVTIIAILYLVGMQPQQAHAAKPGKTSKASKERLVLMPLRVADEDKNLQGTMETALVQGLQQKYEVFSGERVAQKAREIFLKESRSTAKKECDETRCMQGIAEAFQAELIATANVTKRDGGYFLALSIQNIFDNLVVYSNSVPCKHCDSFQVVDKLKELSGESTPISASSPPANGTQEQEQQQQLTKFVSRIQELLAPDSLTATRAGLASELYAEAAKISPNDYRIKTASEQIGDAYLRLATAKADAKNYREADNLINRGMELSPDNRQLAALRKDVAERQKPKHQSFGGF